MANRANTPHDKAKQDAIVAALDVFAKHTPTIAFQAAVEVGKVFQRPEYRHFTEDERLAVIEEAFDYGWPAYSPTGFDPDMDIADRVRASFKLPSATGMG